MANAPKPTLSTKKGGSPGDAPSASYAHSSYGGSKKSAPPAKAAAPKRASPKKAAPTRRAPSAGHQPAAVAKRAPAAKRVPATKRRPPAARTDPQPAPTVDRPAPAAPEPSPAPAPPPPARRRLTRRRVAEDGALIVLAIVIAIVVRTFVAQAYYIPSGSMEPLLHINDRVVVSRLSYHLHPVHRGDVVVFKSPPGVEPPNSVPHNPAVRVVRDIGVAMGFTQDQTVLIKRVIGLPGDIVQGRGGHVYVDRNLLVEPYLPKGTITSSFGPIRVPGGFVFVLGDNRGNSTDSRVFGPVPVHGIVGRAVWRVWPPWRPAFL